jgi:hypothetical protein
MQRLLTKRDKHGSHRRSKSSEPGSKVTSPPNSKLPSSSPSDAVAFSLCKSLFLYSICAAFLDPNGKCLPNVKTTAVVAYGIRTDSIHGSLLQSRPISGHSILALLKPPDRKSDADKKQEKEDAKNVKWPQYFIFSTSNFYRFKY